MFIVHPSLKISVEKTHPMFQHPPLHYIGIRISRKPQTTRSSAGLQGLKSRGAMWIIYPRVFLDRGFGSKHEQNYKNSKD